MFLSRKNTKNARPQCKNLISAKRSAVFSQRSGAGSANCSAGLQLELILITKGSDYDARSLLLPEGGTTGEN